MASVAGDAPWLVGVDDTTASAILLLEVDPEVDVPHMEHAIKSGE